MASAPKRNMMTAGGDVEAPHFGMPVDPAPGTEKITSATATGFYSTAKSSRWKRPDQETGGARRPADPHGRPHREVEWMPLPPELEAAHAVTPRPTFASPLLYHDRLPVLPYHVHAHSSYSANYLPKHILVNKPTDQGSRWSSGTNNQMQYLLLKLEKTSAVYTITFGKYHKVHVCNLREFKVLGGLSPDNMVELLHSGLRNDPEPETFPLKFKTDAGVIFPIRYLKIVPLMAWGANFNFSIWYVELRGLNDQAMVHQIYQNFLDYREKETVRLCLKHCRERQWNSVFASLAAQTGIEVEEPLITQLYDALVLRGAWDETEALLQQMTTLLDENGNGLFEEYKADAPYRPVWRKITATDEHGHRPSMRGGHQMTIDAENGFVYLLGGWDGKRDLADFWCYAISLQQWRCISLDTRIQGGPGPRSCHKIVYDATTRAIYLLGRYVDPEARSKGPLASDFYKFDTVQETWTQISANTSKDGGPYLIYDHQMVVDADQSILWVFGGRTIAADDKDNTYSGLYKYSITSNRWQLIRSDAHQKEPPLKSRIGHSMLFNPIDRHLYIFAGQRSKDYLSDFYIYEIDHDRVIELTRDSSKQGGPDAGFTQRATIDLALGEFYVLAGLMREKHSAHETVKNTFWSFEIAKGKWRRIYKHEAQATALTTTTATSSSSSSAAVTTSMAGASASSASRETGEMMTAESPSSLSSREKEPCPRFAHQLVYDHVRKRQYLFGGNPGESGAPGKRLDDFWELSLIRPDEVFIIRRTKFLIRRQRFRELCLHCDMMEALMYLREHIFPVVDHTVEEEAADFHALSIELLNMGEKDELRSSPLSHRNNPLEEGRAVLFEDILTFLPKDMKQPSGALVDLVKW